MIRVELFVNGKKIGYMELKNIGTAERGAPPDPPVMGEIYNYEWKVNINGKTYSGVDENDVIVHRRQFDGAWIVVGQTLDRLYDLRYEMEDETDGQTAQAHGREAPG